MKLMQNNIASHETTINPVSKMMLYIDRDEKTYFLMVLSVFRAFKVMTGTAKVMTSFIKVMTGIVKVMTGTVKVMTGIVKVVTGTVKVMTGMIKVMTGNVEFMKIITI
jgi:hypothetical protein